VQLLSTPTAQKSGQLRKGQRVGRAFRFCPKSFDEHILSSAPAPIFWFFFQKKNKSPPARQINGLAVEELRGLEELNG